MYFLLANVSIADVLSSKIGDDDDDDKRIQRNKSNTKTQ